MKYLLLIILLFNFVFAKQDVTLQLLWKHQFEFAGYYIAKELGFYDDVGLNVYIKEIEPKVNVTTEVKEGRATFGIGRTSLLVDINNGFDFVLLASIFQYSPSVLLTLKSSNISVPQDLRDKNVMIASGSEYDAEFFTAFRNLGIDFIKDTKIQQHSTDINDLINKNTDAMYAYISNEPFMLRERGIEFNILNPKNYGFDFYGDMLFTTQNTIDKDPKMVADFKEATLKGFVWAFNNIDKTVDLIYDKYNSQNKSKEALTYEAYELKKMAYYETDTLGAITKTKLKRMVDLYKDNDLLSKDLDLDKIVFEYNKNELFLTDDEKSYLNAKKILKVHNELNYKPFNFYLSNKPTGYSIDLMNLIAQKLGIQVEYITGPSWNNFLELLKSNKIDVMLNITPTENRLKHFRFTAPYKKYNYIIYSNSASKVGSIDDLNGKTIALVKGFAIYEYIKSNFGNINIVEVDSMEEAIHSVSFGKTDATITTQPIANSIIIENSIYNVVPTGNVFIANQDLSQVHLSLATNKNQEILHKILDKTIQSISYDEFLALETKWFESLSVNDQKLQFNSKEISYLNTKGVINLCIDPDWMPYEAIKNGMHQGLSKDFVDIFEAKIGIPIKLIPTNSWGQSIQYAKDRKCDIFSLAMDTKERREYMNFTKEYIKSPLVIATKHDKLFVNDISEVISTHKLGIVDGYAFADIYNNKYPNNKLVRVDNLKQGLDLVASGELFGMIDSLITIGFHLKSNYIGELKIAGKFDESWELGVGVRNDDLILLDIFDKVIESIDEKTKQDIVDKWTGVVLNTQTNYQDLYKWIFGFFGVLLILAYRQYVLKQYNQTLQKANIQIQEANDKISQKQDELYALNKILESRVKDEVEANILKDKLLQQQTRLAQMGELISMIAHQWRQPLACIASTAIGIRFKIDLQKYDLSTNEGIKEFEKYLRLQLDDIEKFSQNLTQTIDDFKDFYKPNKKLNYTKVENVILKALDIIEVSMVNNSKVKIEKDFKSTKNIELYNNELMQVFLNILKNSDDNFKEKNINNRLIKISTKDVKNGVEVEVWDNGGGIKEEYLDKIFDPYFSTKEEKNGTGLGLYMSKVIVCESHHGEIYAHNKNGGVSFILILNQNKEI